MAFYKRANVVSSHCSLCYKNNCNALFNKVVTIKKYAVFERFFMIVCLNLCIKIRTSIVTLNYSPRRHTGQLLFL